MARTTAQAVKDVLMSDYGKKADGTYPSLAPFIRAAGLVVDEVVNCTTRKNRPQTVAVLTEMETWLAAHFYTKSDAVYSSRSTQSASGSFVRAPGEPEPYKDGALSLDFSGCLAAILNRKRATTFWAGRPPSEQTDYINRE